jgi:hypothetical protein
MLKKTLFAGIVLACCATSFADQSSATVGFAPVPNNCSVNYEGTTLPASTQPSQTFPLSYSDSNKFTVTCDHTTAAYTIAFSNPGGVVVSFIGKKYTSQNAVSVTRNTTNPLKPQCVTPTVPAQFPLDPKTGNVLITVGGSC